MWKFILSFVFIVFVSSPVLAQDVHNSEPAETKQTDTEQESAPKNEPTSEPIPDIGASQTLDTGNADSQTKTHQDNAPKTSLENRDHKAQVSMSWAAWVQSIITAFGLWLIWRTLIQTKKATQATEIAANAAKDAVEVSRAQMRPNVRIKSCYIKCQGENIHINISFQNTGNSEALNFKQTTAKAVMIEGHTRPAELTNEALKDYTPIILMPNDTKSKTITLEPPHSKNISNKVLSEGHVLHIVGIMSYQDIYKNVTTQTFAFYSQSLSGEMSLWEHKTA